MFGFRDGFAIVSSKMERFYKKLCSDALKDYESFTPNEILVLIFLSNENNRPFDTATDIVKYRNTSKSLVARSVDSLCQRGFLIQKRDKKDRRIVHLHLTEQSDEIVKRLSACRENFNIYMQKGLSEEDIKTFKKVSSIMEKNLEEMIRETIQNTRKDYMK